MDGLAVVNTDFMPANIGELPDLKDAVHVRDVTNILEARHVGTHACSISAPEPREFITPKRMKELINAPGRYPDVSSLELSPQSVALSESALISQQLVLLERAWTATRMDEHPRLDDVGQMLTTRTGYFQLPKVSALACIEHYAGPPEFGGPPELGCKCPRSDPH